MNKKLTDESFSSALLHEDDLGSVIRVHLHVEFHVNEILNILTPYPEDLKPLQLDYDGKVNLICALGVQPKYKPIVSALGKMRNKFAHNPFYRLDKSEVNNLYKALESTDREILQESHEKTRKTSGPVEIRPYKELSPKDQFILIAVVIRNIVLAIKNEIQ
ncbi:MAG: hypothetical protein ABH833_01005 [Parcubacteria group bacterium]